MRLLIVPRKQALTVKTESRPCDRQCVECNLSYDIVRSLSLLSVCRIVDTPSRCADIAITLVREGWRTGVPAYTLDAVHAQE